MSEIFRAENKNDLERCYPVMKELRTSLSFENYINLYEQAHAKDGYEIMALQQDRKILAVMGYRILYDYVHGKHIYIDDLVSTSTERSKGFGAQFLEYAEQIARQQGCQCLRLCTGIENELGKKFYEKSGWNLRAVAYKKKL